MNANLLATAGLPFNGAGCRIAVYDEGRRGEVRQLNQAGEADEHARRITGFLTDTRLQGFASGCELLSVSFHDCLERGYDAVKKQLVAEHGPVHIEAHAYSCPASKATARYEQQIARTARDPDLRSLILCSPGHDPHRVRFPATSSAAVTVGLLRADNNLVGAGPGELLKPALLVADQPFPAFDGEDRIVPVSGTSPAVTFVAGLAALIHEQLQSPDSPLQLHAALLLLSTPCRDTYLLDRIDVLRQPLMAQTLTPGKGRRRSVRLRVQRNADAFCRVAIAADACGFEPLAQGHRFALTVDADIDGTIQHVADHRLLLPLNDLAADESREITLQIDGLADACALAWTGARVEVLADNVTPVKTDDDTVVVGISASHDASAVLALNGQLIAGIQLERLTRVKHDGQSSLSHDEAIRYCLDVAGLSPDDVDMFAFNVQALTPSYVGLSQPLARDSFTVFDPFGPKSLFVSHHLCHAFAGYSGSEFDDATVVVADGSGGVTVGYDDLVLDGEQLGAYLRRGKGADALKLHTFSVYEFNRQGYRLKHREYASSFNVRSGSESLGETYAAVSQFVFNSWQASGKLMGLAPYGTAAQQDTYLQRGADGELNFSFDWKLSASLAPAGHDVMRFANLAARIQSDLETAILDRFGRHIGGGIDLVYSGGIALNSVANYRIRSEIRPRALYLLPAQHDAGIAIGAAAAALHRLGGQTPSHLFRHDFLGYRYSERDAALAINEFADRLQVRRVTPFEIAAQIADGAVFGFFSLSKGSEFGPRALGARSILADPRKRSVWNFVNKWVKYREEFRPFAPMVAAEALTDYFDAKGRFPYMLEVVKVREVFRAGLAGITHVDGSARVQTVSADEDPEIHALLVAFQSVGGVPILLNTSFNVRGQPMVEQPKHALEMLLSTQLSGVIFGDLLVEVADCANDVTEDDSLGFSPGTSFELTASQDGVQGVMRVRSQGKAIQLHGAMSQVMQAVAAGCDVGAAILRAGTGQEAMSLETLRRFVRLRMLNRLHPTTGRTKP
ncbi:carbamoyltransferase [Paraburkholderia sp. GAS199]|uniref:carbamoyltransferase C-terminal domain-containing protein n=1 Tax=Paraburkholderia sp. GAS199 TaxID=3035126 RepID=UPI003D1A26D8